MCDEGGGRISGAGHVSSKPNTYRVRCVGGYAPFNPLINSCPGSETVVRLGGEKPQPASPS